MLFDLGQAALILVGSMIGVAACHFVFDEIPPGSARYLARPKCTETLMLDGAVPRVKSSEGVGGLEFEKKV